MMTGFSKKYGFTLIELLVVVAVIGILSSIAVPNFLQAQTRALVVRTQADMKAIETALIQYKMDNNAYFSGYLSSISPSLNKWEMIPLTTPVAYLPYVPQDHFRLGSRAGYEDYAPYDYYCGRCGFVANAASASGMNVNAVPDFTLSSDGPNRIYDYNSVRGYLHYDPSNGVVSEGDIWLIKFGTLN